MLQYGKPTPAVCIASYWTKAFTEGCQTLSKGRMSLILLFGCKTALPLLGETGSERWWGGTDMLLSCLGPKWTWKPQECCSAASYLILCSSSQQLRKTSTGSCGGDLEKPWRTRQAKARWGLVYWIGFLSHCRSISYSAWDQVQFGDRQVLLLFLCCSFPI